MINAIEVKNFAIVDSLRLELATGFTALTGETGAGKSLIVDAIGLLLGGRADSSWVREGEDKALLQLELAQNLSLTRRLSKNGRGQVRIDGEIAKVAELASVAQERIAIHGQHASQTLLDASEQRKLLDRLLPQKAQELVQDYQKNFREQQQVKKELEALTHALRERARRVDILQFQLEEIDNADLQPEEEEELRDKAMQLENIERILQGAGGAVDLLLEQEENALDKVASAQVALQNAGRFHKELAGLAEELAEAMSNLQAVADAVSSVLVEIDVEPAEIEAVQQRLYLIKNLQKKYGAEIADVLAYRDGIAVELEQLLSAETTMDRLEQRQEELAQQLTAQATHISQARQKIATNLSQKVTAQVRPLAMPHAEFQVQLSALKTANFYGNDKIDFLFSANLGEKPAPLNAVASGGELSRVMLALNVVTGTDVPTLIFDEVDAGIGGATALAVGELLATLAQQHQVLVVTHLPQVAAYADQHILVEKIEKAGRTVSRIHQLNAPERQEELARMLSGSTGKAALANAQELLEHAQQHQPLEAAS